MAQENKFPNQIEFPTQFGTTTSDGFHIDSDAVRYLPDEADADTGMRADGITHASVENALKERVVTITLNGRTLRVDANGNVDLGNCGNIYDGDEVTIHKNEPDESHDNEYFSVIEYTEEALLDMLTRVGIIRRMFYSSTENADTSLALGISAHPINENNS